MDLRKEEAKTVLRKLIRVSDVLVQNFRPGTMNEMGFGYEVLKDLNPRIIMVNISAYGQFGPYREQIGYDPIGQTMSGIAMVTGEQGMPPIRAGVPIIDRTTALHSAIGTLGALFERSISGMGQSIDVCLADSGYSLTEIPITAYHGAGTEPKRGESSAPPSGMYPCKDGWILIAAGDQHHWPRVCKALGRPEWQEDPRFTTRRERSKHVPVVKQAMEHALAGMTMKEAIAHFTRHDVTAAPVNTIAQAAQDPHPWERRALVEVPDFLAGTIAVSGDFWHFSRTPAVVGSTPRVGEHNEEVLGDLLGYSKEEIAKLYASDVIGNSHHYETLAG
jgi:crotonobetainyl-CoA:carnitine CoA-transferase CaiB-like acyl-CoA transferase